MQGREREIDTLSEDPSPTLPTYIGKLKKGKIVEGKKGESNYANKKALDLLLKPKVFHKRIDYKNDRHL